MSAQRTRTRQARQASLAAVPPVADSAPAGRGFAPLTRRHFFGLLLATGAVALAAETAAPPRAEGAARRPRWIGHC